MQETGPRQPREHAVVGRDDRMEAAGVVARGFLRCRGVALDEPHLPASRAQPLADRGTREAGAMTTAFLLRVEAKFASRMYRARSISFLLPKPAAFSTAKPAASSAAR